jgi:hypothetical protein
MRSEHRRNLKVAADQQLNISPSHSGLKELPCLWGKNLLAEADSGWPGIRGGGLFNPHL